MIISFVGSYFELQNRLDLSNNIQHPGVIAFAILIFCFVVLFLADSSRFNSPNHRAQMFGTAVSTVGLMTYPFYLLHETVEFSIRDLLGSIGLSVNESFLTVFLICVILSYFMVTFLDPIMKSRLANWIEI